MIPQERIDHIKASIDLKGYIESRGIPLKKNGKGYFGLCPFHDDTNPSLSVTPTKRVWNCLGCEAGGDIFRFVEMFDNVNFKEAFQKLEDGSPAPKVPKKKAVKKTKNAAKKIKKDNPPPDDTFTVKEKKLLARVMAYYQNTFAENSRGIEYLRDKRGISDNQSFKDFGVGYADGTLKDILPEDEEIIKSLKKIGILNKNGKEAFSNCVVFPLWDAKGAIVNLYGRKIDEDSGITHLYLPGPQVGMINRQAVKRSQTILLTESVIDALTLYDQGFKNVIPTYGVNGLTKDHLSLFNGRIKEIYIVFDADEAGTRGAEGISLQLNEKNITPHIVTLPAKDVNLYFNRHTPEEFESLLKAANPKSLEQSETIGKRKQTRYQEVDHGFIVGYGDRQYHIKGMQRSDTQLKATIKASKDVTANLPFELTTIDLYSSRSRLWFAKLCSGLFDALEELVKEDVGKILTLVEEYRPNAKKETTKEPTGKEKETALKFLKNPDMFEEVLTDLETLGVTGEKSNKIVCYLTTISRKLDDPLSTLIQSRSSAGKSTLHRQNENRRIYG